MRSDEVIWEDFVNHQNIETIYCQHYYYDIYSQNHKELVKVQHRYFKY